MIGTIQLAILFNYSRQGMLKLLKRLDIPLVKKGKKVYFDETSDHPLALSLKLYDKTKGLRLVYTVNDLARIYQRSKRTVFKIIKESNILTYGRKKKKFIFLSDLWQLRSHLRKNAAPQTRINRLRARFPGN